MSTSENAIAIRKESIHLVATNPTEMEAACQNLKEFLIQKIEALDVDITDLNASIAQAREQKWNSTNLARMRNQAVGNQEFYSKIYQAVEAGYTIVPDFPASVFAIRVEREFPTGADQVSAYKGGLGLDLEEPDILPAGYGDYVSPIPEARRYATETENADKKISKHYHADPTKFRDVVFPLKAARVEVMNAICPSEPKPDPLILGQILTKRRNYTQKTVNFLIAWHLNMRQL